MMPVPKNGDRQSKVPLRARMHEQSSRIDNNAARARGEMDMSSKPERNGSTTKRVDLED
jgi:hypothetical protein